MTADKKDSATILSHDECELMVETRLASYGFKTTDDGTIRSFDTGATRDTAEGKYDYEGFLSPIVLEAFGRYMHSHRLQSDGSLRDSDNWQKGFPKEVYMKSLLRHLIVAWREHRACEILRATLIEALCGIMFNSMGYLHEVLKDD